MGFPKTKRRKTRRRRQCPKKSRTRLLRRQRLRLLRRPCLPMRRHRQREQRRKQEQRDSKSLLLLTVARGDRKPQRLDWHVANGQFGFARVLHSLMLLVDFIDEHCCR